MSELNTVRQMSTDELAALGLFDVAFVKPVTVAGSESYEIHTADGQFVADAPSWEAAADLIRENELVPARVH